MTTIIYEFVDDDFNRFWSTFSDFSLDSGDRPLFSLSLDGLFIGPSGSPISHSNSLGDSRMYIVSRGYAISDVDALLAKAEVAPVAPVVLESAVRQAVADEVDVNELVEYLLDRGRSDTQALILADRINRSVGASRIKRVAASE